MRSSPNQSRPQDAAAHLTSLRLAFWAAGLLLAIMQAWSYRYFASADAVSYLDLSDGVSRDWQRLISGVWSPLYPFLLGIGRRILGTDPSHEIVVAHFLNIPIFAFAFAAFEFFLRSMDREKSSSDGNATDSAYLPQWAVLSIAYALFLWATIGQITLQTLRPDMLMAGFLF